MDLNNELFPSMQLLGSDDSGGFGFFMRSENEWYSIFPSFSWLKELDRRRNGGGFSLKALHWSRKGEFAVASPWDPSLSPFPHSLPHIKTYK